MLLVSSSALVFVGWLVDRCRRRRRRRTRRSPIMLVVMVAYVATVV